MHSQRARRRPRRSGSARFEPDERGGRKRQESTIPPRRAPLPPHAPGRYQASATGAEPRLPPTASRTDSRPHQGSRRCRLRFGRQRQSGDDAATPGAACGVFEELRQLQTDVRHRMTVASQTNCHRTGLENATGSAIGTDIYRSIPANPEAWPQRRLTCSATLPSISRLKFARQADFCRDKASHHTYPKCFHTVQTPPAAHTHLWTGPCFKAGKLQARAGHKARQASIPSRTAAMGSARQRR